jgi:hypothetical protein
MALSNLQMQEVNFRHDLSSHQQPGLQLGNNISHQPPPVTRFHQELLHQRSRRIYRLHTEKTKESHGSGVCINYI